MRNIWLLHVYSLLRIGYYTTFIAIALVSNERYDQTSYCVKSVRIQSFPGQYFPAFELNTEKFGVSLYNQSKCGKIRTRKTPNTDFSCSVCLSDLESLY